MKLCGFRSLKKAWFFFGWVPTNSIWMLVLGGYTRAPLFWNRTLHAPTPCTPNPIPKNMSTWRFLTCPPPALAAAGSCDDNASPELRINVSKREVGPNALEQGSLWYVTLLCSQMRIALARLTEIITFQVILILGS